MKYVCLRHSEAPQNVAERRLDSADLAVGHYTYKSLR